MIFQFFFLLIKNKKIEELNKIGAVEFLDEYMYVGDNNDLIDGRITKAYTNVANKKHAKQKTAAKYLICIPLNLCLEKEPKYNNAKA